MGLFDYPKTSLTCWPNYSGWNWCGDRRPNRSGGLQMASSDITTTGIVCDCGAAELRVLRTTASAGFIIRRRECSACGRRVTTVERRIDTAPATGSGLFQISIGQIRQSLDLLADLASGKDNPKGK